MTFSVKTLDVVCLVFLVILCLLGGYWVVDRGAKQRRQIEQENEILSKSLKDLNVAESNLQNLTLAFDNARAELEALNERIPEKGKFGQFLKQVDALMKEENIDLVSLEPLPTVEERRFTKIPIRLICEGPFLNIYRLIHDLETMHRMVLLEKMEIKKLKSGPLCRADLTASAFER